MKDFRTTLCSSLRLRNQGGERCWVAVECCGSCVWLSTLERSVLLARSIDEGWVFGFLFGAGGFFILSRSLRSVVQGDRIEILLGVCGRGWSEHP